MYCVYDTNKYTVLFSEHFVIVVLMFMLALDKTMKYSDVFIKSDLGRKEIKNHSLGILPREARTLLIMIDGKRNYQSYLDTLDNGKMFVEFGGVTPLFELLLELDCIEIVEQGSLKSKRDPRPQPVKETSKAEFDRTFNNPEPDITTIGHSATKVDNASYEATKSELASYIETNALPEEAWGYLLSLEQCNDPKQLISLVQQIQKSSNKALASGMADFSEKINTYI